MMNFKNTKMAKVISGFVGLSTAVMMMGPAVASAATVEELTAQINALLAQVSALQASQSSSTAVTTTGHMFSVDLTIGSKGDDVVALQQILVAKGYLVMPAGVSMGYFGALTKSAVSKWQAASGISPTAGYVGPKSRAALNAMGGSSSTTTTTTTTTTTGTGTLPVGCSSTVGYSPINGQSCAVTTTVVGTGVSVMLDASSPMSKTIIAGQSVATLGIFKISNGGSSAAKVTSVKLKRTGVSADTTLSNVYLYAGATRLTDAASVASGVISFNDTAGIITIPVGGSVALSIRADIAAATNGQTIGVMLTDVVADAVAATGVPVSGAEHTIAAAPSGMTTADFTTAAATPAAASIDPQSDYTMWQESVSIGSRDALLSSIRLRQIGSVAMGDLKNFRLMVDGVQVGTTVDSLDVNGYVTFNFATPVTLKTGTRVIKLVGDMIGGSNRNFQFSLRQAGDAEIWDSQLNVTILPTVASGTFAAVSNGLQTINTGTLTITKRTDSTSGNVVISGSGVTLAKFDVKAQGERLKVESLRISHTASDAVWTKIRNGALFLNGAQIGSTADINEDSQSTPYTQYNLGSSMVLEPGVAYVLEVRGDVYNVNTAANTALSAGTTTIVNIAAGSSNVQRLSSLSYFANTAVSGNTLTVAAGTLALSKYAAYANQTIVVPQTAYKIAEYRLTTGSTEAVNIDTITAVLSGTVAEVSNLYVVYGTKTSSIKATGAATQSWSINEPLAANSTMNVAIYATLSTNLTGIVSASTTISGTSQASGSAVTSATAVEGQLITVGSGTLTTAVDASTPVAMNAVSNSMPKVASFKFTSANDAFTLIDVGVKVGGTDNASAIQSLTFKDGATVLGNISGYALNGLIATGTALNVSVPANTSKVIDVYAQLGSIGTGFATTSQNVMLTMDCVKYRNSNGVDASDCTDRAGNNIYVFKTKPTITNLALPTTVLNTGTITIGKVRIAADSAGSIAWRRIVWNVSTSSPSGSFVVSSPALYDAADESTALTNVTLTLNTAAVSSTFNIIASSTIAVDSEQQIPAGGYKDYVLKATVSGSPVTGSAISTSLLASSTSRIAPTNSHATNLSASSTFVWSDMSVANHSTSTADWMNDYLVKNLPTDAQTLTK